jgi:hypothetical protein
MKLTTKDIVVFLPFDKALKDKIMAELDKPNTDRRIAIVEFLWSAYDELYEMQYQTNLEVAMREIEEKDLPVPENLKKQVEEQTKKEMEKEMDMSSTNKGLEEVRNKLADILQEPKQTTTSN